jgi:hypothetical protein
VPHCSHEKKEIYVDRNSRRFFLKDKASSDAEQFGHHSWIRWHYEPLDHVFMYILDHVHMYDVCTYILNHDVHIKSWCTYYINHDLHITSIMMYILNHDVHIRSCTCTMNP